MQTTLRAGDLSGDPLASDVLRKPRGPLAWNISPSRVSPGEKKSVLADFRVGGCKGERSLSTGQGRVWRAGGGRVRWRVQ